MRAHLQSSGAQSASCQALAQPLCSLSQRTKSLPPSRPHICNVPAPREPHAKPLLSPSQRTKSLPPSRPHICNVPAPRVSCRGLVSACPNAPNPFHPDRPPRGQASPAPTSGGRWRRSTAGGRAAPTSSPRPTTASAPRRARSGASWSSSRPRRPGRTCGARPRARSARVGTGVGPTGYRVPDGAEPRPRWAWLQAVLGVTVSARHCASLRGRLGGRFGREIPRIADLMKLEVAKNAKLLEVEVIAVVLYTGPMVRRPSPLACRSCATSRCVPPSPCSAHAFLISWPGM